MILNAVQNLQYKTVYNTSPVCKSDDFVITLQFGRSGAVFLYVAEGNEADKTDPVIQ
jgi:hypothetical protein